MARTAYNSNLIDSFLWLSLHCIEKYLKSILLMNNFSAIDHGHDIVKIYNDVIRNFPQIKIEDMQFPDFNNFSFEGVTGENFINLLNSKGDISTRYGLTGYDYGGEELFYLDAFVYHLRRHCKPLIYEKKIFDKYYTINNIKINEENPDKWHLNPKSILEDIYEGGKFENLLDSFKKNNPIFFGASHKIINYRMGSRRSPFLRSIHFMNLDREKIETRVASRNALLFALVNIKIDKKLKKEIEENIKEFDKSMKKSVGKLLSIFVNKSQ
jgi:hypothetical protein